MVSVLLQAISARICDRKETWIWDCKSLIASHYPMWRKWTLHIFIGFISHRYNCIISKYKLNRSRPTWYHYRFSCLVYYYTLGAKWRDYLAIAACVTIMPGSWWYLHNHREPPPRSLTHHMPRSVLAAARSRSALRVYFHQPRAQLIRCCLLKLGFGNISLNELLMI